MANKIAGDLTAEDIKLLAEAQAVLLNASKEQSQKTETKLAYEIAGLPKDSIRAITKILENAVGRLKPTEVEPDVFE